MDNQVFDVGTTTRESLDQARPLLVEGLSPVGRRIYHEHSADDGTLMRLLPLALLHRGDDREMAMELSGLTHAHPS